MVFGRRSENRTSIAGNLSQLPHGTRAKKPWRERLIPTSAMARIMLGFCIIEALATIVLEIFINIYHKEQVTHAAYLTALGGWGAIFDNSSRGMQIVLSEEIVIYHYIFIAAQVFQVIMMWTALVHKNTLQLIGACIFAYFLAVYTYMQTIHPRLDKYEIRDAYKLAYSTPHKTETYEMISTAVTVTAAILMTVLCRQLYHEFGWFIYKKLGADLRIARMYRQYQIAMTLLEFGVFFFIAYSVQLVVLTPSWVDGIYLVQFILILPLSILLIVIAVYALRNEKKHLMLVFLALTLAFIGYLIFIAVNIVSKGSEVARITNGTHSGGDPYPVTRPFLLFFIGVTLALSLAIFIYGVLCYRSFGKGLLQHRRQHKLGIVAAPTNATEEEAIRISMMNRSDTAQRQELLD